MKTANPIETDVPGPRITRVRHAVRLRSLRVEAVARVTPGMLRVTLSGEDLADFTSLGFDDHVKVLVPAASGDIARRDYTPRRHDAQARTLALDFALHDAGPATRWALDARPGDGLQVAGPKGSVVIAPDMRRWLLIGDETALPAIGRRIEEAETGAQVTSVVAVAGPEEEQTFATRADLTALWAHRPLSTADDFAALLAVLKTIDLQPETFVWIAAEAAVARSVRDYILGERGHPRGWMKAGGYWIRGRADAHEKMD